MNRTPQKFSAKFPSLLDFVTRPSKSARAPYCLVVLTPMSMSMPMCALVVAFIAQPPSIQEDLEILSRSFRAICAICDLTPVRGFVFFLA